MLCRGCCCGTSAKHPRTDHDGQLRTLEHAASPAASPAVALRVVDCLDECDRSNVVLVRRPRAPRKERDTWFGGVLTEAATSALADWVREGAPAGSVPSRLSALAFRHLPPRRR